MTKVEWEACTDPIRLIAFVRPTLSPRKARLCAAALCRRLWPWLNKPASRRAVEVSEQYADDERVDLAGFVREAELAADQAVGDWEGWADPYKEVYMVAAGVAVVAASGEANPQVVRNQGLDFYPAQVASGVAEVVRTRVSFQRGADAGRDAHKALAEERAGQCGVLRDLCQPFRRSAGAAPWVSGDAGRVAAQAYSERAFDGLPVLADALEEAGCLDAELLAHLRGPGHHVRGCWAVDLCLGLS